MKFFLLLLLIISSFTISCHNEKGYPVKVKHKTLFFSSNGSFINFNLDENKINWEYNSAIDSTGNRNYFAVDGQSVFMSFESGKLINFDLNTGKIIWKHQIYGVEDQVLDMSSAENAEAEMLKPMMPLFMTKPLVDGENIVIASTGQPSVTQGYLYKFSKASGEKKWHEELPTQFNLFAPVKYRNFYFVNSAVFLRKINIEDGSSMSYNMFDANTEVAGQPTQNHEVNQFQYPIYNQMQSDDKNIYIGDEKGRFFCLNLDKNADLPNGDISDFNNTFIKNPKVFKWVFSDESFDFQENNITFLEDGVLYTEMKNGAATQSCLYAIATENGKPKWKKVINGNVLNWSQQNDKIIGNTKNTIFYLDKKGDNFVEIKIEDKPLSNIALMDKTHLIYVTQKGIEVLDTETKTTKIIYKKPHNHQGEHNYVQIKYIGK